MLETLLKDLQYGLRMIRKSPGFTAIAVLSLGLGIGANTAIFTLIDAVMLRSLPVAAPQELVSVGDPSRTGGLSTGGPRVDLFSVPLYQRLRAQTQLFSGLLASGKTGRIDVTIGDSVAEQARGRLVSGNYFDVLGVPALLGRTFTSDEDRIPSASAVVVISHDYWERHFARDPEIVGRTLRLNGAVFKIAGVGPPHFAGDVVGTNTEIWIPLAMQAQVNPGDPRLANRNANWLLLMGRLKPGATPAGVRTEMTTLVHRALIDYVEGPNARDAQLADRDAFYDRALAVIQAIHARGVAHADLKRRDNILVGAGEQPLLLDFGLAVLRAEGFHPLNHWLFDLACRFDLNAWIKHKYRYREGEISETDGVYHRPLPFESAWRRIRRFVRAPLRALRQARGH